MIKKYNEYINEKLTDKLSGFDEHELFNQYLDKKINIYKFVDMYRQYNLNYPNEKIVKQYVMDGKIPSYEYDYLCKTIHFNFLSNVEMKKLFDENKIDILRYNNYCKVNNLDLPSKDEIFKHLSKLDPNTMLINSIITNNLDGVKLALSKYAELNVNTLSYINDIDILKYLDEHNINIFTNDIIFKESINNGNIEIFKYMLDKYNIQNAEKDHLINKCILHKQYDILKILLEYGANVTMKDINNVFEKRNFEWLYLVIQYYKGEFNYLNFDNIIYALINADKIEIIKYILEHGYIIKDEILPKNISDEMKNLLQEYDK